MSRSPQMSVIRAAIADFPFDGYGIDLGGADPAWVGDLAAAITGALPAASSNGQPAQDFFQPGHGYTHRDGTDFLCVTVTDHPVSGERLAIGWRTDVTGLHFLAYRHIGHWLHDYDGCKPPEDTAYANTRGEPGDGISAPCSVPECNTDGTGEPCAAHEREQAHAEGEHAFCGPECRATVPGDGA